VIGDCMLTRQHVIGWLTSGIACCAIVVVVGCRTAGEADRREPPADVKVAAVSPIAPLAFFERSCASCHGPFGTFYGDTFATKLDDASLIQVVGAMVRGPARSTLDPLSLNALVAFHRALRNPKSGPFLVVTAVDRTRILGEVSPGCDVVIVVGGVSVEATVDSCQWHATMPSTATTGAVVVSARSSANKLVTTLDITKQTFSHATPSVEDADH